LLRCRYKQNQRCSGGFRHATHCDPLIPSFVDDVALSANFYGDKHGHGDEIFESTEQNKLFENAIPRLGARK
jgi:hypothetical protein